MAKETFSFEEALGDSKGAENSKPARTAVESVARQVGLTARAGVNGLVALPAMMADAVTGPINAGLDAYDEARAPSLKEVVIGKQKGFRFKRTSAAVDELLTKVGLPQPENATERVVQDIASSLAGTGGTVQLGRQLANKGGALAAGVGESLAAGPKLQLASAAAGAGASGTVRENGGSEGAQALAGLAAGLTPALAPAAGTAVARRALRGGEAGRQRVAENIATFEAAGVQPTLGQAAGGKMQRAEALIAKAPGGAGVIADFADKQANQMAASVQKLSDELAPGSNATNAGEAIERGVKAFKSGFQTVQQKLYANLDKHIPSESRIAASNTQAALADLNTDIAGAPALSKWFKNARIQGIETGLNSDTGSITAVLSRPGMKEKAAQLRAQLEGDAVRIQDQNAQRSQLGMRNLEQVPTQEQIQSQVDDFLSKQIDNRIPYESLKKLRTLVGRELADNSLVADVPRSKWNALYGALSEDLGVAAKAAGPEAEKSWDWANRFTRKKLALLDQLSSVVNRDGPEKIFNAAVAGTAEGATTITRVMNALPAEERRQVAAAVLQRLGRATNGQQNAMGDAFSSETFLSNLSKISPQARKTLFGRTDVAGIEQQVGNFAKVAELRREGGKVFANPSGTASAGAQLVNASAIGGGITQSIATGNPAPLMLAVTPMVAANLGAKALTSPKVAKFAAGATQLRAGTAATAVGTAGRIGDTAEPVAAPGPATFTFEEAMGGDTPAIEGSPAGQNLDGAPAAAVGAQPPAMQPEAPQQQPFQSQARPDGTLAINGDAEALRQLMQQAGVPARSIMSTKTGVVVGRSQVERVQRALQAIEEQPQSEQLAPEPYSAITPETGSDVIASTDTGTTALEQTATQPRPDGTLAIPGGGQQVREMLLAGGIPAQAIVPTADGLLLGKSWAARGAAVLAPTGMQPLAAATNNSPQENEPLAQTDTAQAATETIANVQDPTQATGSGAEAQATPVETPTAMASNAAPTQELPGTGSPADLQSAGLNGEGAPQIDGSPVGSEQLAESGAQDPSQLADTQPMARIDQMAHAAATSPLNDRPEPSEAQKRAGNYPMGHDRIAGMDVSIENPQGSVRRGVDPDGQPWQTKMQHHYGYLKGTTAADGDKLDVFIKPGTPKDYAGPVFVIDQIDPKTGKLDEHKTILGAKDEKEAKEIYAANYAPDWKGMGSITRLPLPVFKAWAQSGSKKEPLGDLAAAREEVEQADRSAEQLAEMKLEKLRSAGEDVVAGLMQKRRNGKVGEAPLANEIELLQRAEPIARYAAMPEFQAAYRSQRSAGRKPAESVAFASVLASIDVVAPKIGMPKKAIEAMNAHLQNIPLEAAPGFVDRFTKGLIKRGVMQEFEGSEQIGQRLQETMDTAMNGAVDALYGG